MTDEWVCAQDQREEELKKEGYETPKKAYFRIGRAIFTVETITKDYSLREAVGTPLGLVMAMNGNEKLQEEESLKMLQEMFGSTGYLQIICEGDPDCGFASNDEILLTGYRAGLDDVIVDRTLLQSVHGDHEQIMINFADWFENRISWIHVPRWETYDGFSYSVKSDKKLEAKGKRLAKRIREFAEEMKHLDDVPEDVKERLKNNSSIQTKIKEEQ